MSIKADSNMKQLFSRPLPFESTIEGEVNGERFVLHGSGVGDTRNGTINGKWVCTSGKVGISWEVLAPTFGYGFECFSKVPEDGGVTNFCLEAIKHGYTQERQTHFSCGIGVISQGSMDTHHEITLEKSADQWKVVSKVSLKAKIPVRSLLLEDGALEQQSRNGTMVQLVPVKNGVDTSCSIFYPGANGQSGYGVIASQQTKQRQLVGKKMKKVQPHNAVHWKHVQLTLFRDEKDARANRVLNETSTLSTRQQVGEEFTQSGG